MAKINDYRKPPVTYRYTYDYYRALTTTTGFTEGDILKRSQIINEQTNTVTETEWENLDTAVILITAPTIGTDVEALDGSRVSKGSESLPVGSSSTTLAAIPDGANLAEIHVLDADVVFTLDGSTTPVGSPVALGFRAGDGQNFELESRDEIVNFEVVRLATTDARLYVEYYREFDRNE